MADPVDSLVRVATTLIKHVGTTPVLGFALIFMSIYLFDISEDVTSVDPVFYWFSRISVPVLFVYGLVAITVHWFRPR